MLTTVAIASLVAGFIAGRYLRRAAGEPVRPIIPNVRDVFLVDPAGNCWRQ
jgi:hypothetical protein